MRRRYFVYILTNTVRSVLYVGMTNDPIRRLLQHRTKAVAAFTRAYGVHRMVYFEEHGSLLEARARAHTLKRWRRSWKFKLIESVNPEWRDLSNELIQI